MHRVATGRRTGNRLIPGRAAAAPGARWVLVVHADLGKPGWNDIVVDGRGHAYVNGAGFNPMTGELFGDAANLVDGGYVIG